MSLQLLFWMIYIIAIVFGFWSSYEAGQPLWYRRAGAYMVLWLLVGILGWEVFGAAIHR
jgi:ABC-type polysaccharide/polyol phosphate export permease